VVALATVLASIQKALNFRAQQEGYFARAARLSTLLGALRHKDTEVKETVDRYSQIAEAAEEDWAKKVVPAADQNVMADANKADKADRRR
jgi:hypothetical protein